MGQLATQAAEIDKRSTNTFPSNTISNPREECKAITLISKQVVGTEAYIIEEPVNKEASKKAQAKEKHTLERHPNNSFPVDVEQYKVKSPVPKYSPKFYTLRGFKKKPKTSSFQSSWKFSENYRLIFMRCWSKCLSMLNS
ncbi:hypothetical protein AHAS_Ahas05G0080200 [Arachis hypogaea]